MRLLMVKLDFNKDNKNMNRKTKRIVKAISASGGRFFGLTTRQGETLNAQFVRETPRYVVVRDRNAQENRKFAKTSLQKFSMGAIKI
jgi:hypothetical protein